MSGYFLEKKSKIKKKYRKIEKNLIQKKKMYFFFIKSGKLPDMTGLIPLKMKKTGHDYGLNPLILEKINEN